MLSETYKIRKAIVIPLSIAVFSLAVLFLLSIFFLSLSGEKLVLSAIFFILFYLFLEVFSREVSLQAEGVSIKKFMRKKEIAWDDITLVDSYIVVKKVYLLLTTRKGFYILSNNYDKFSQLLGRIKEHLDEGRIEKETIILIEHPLQNNKPVFSAWLMAILVVAILTLRLYMIFFITGK
jgi:hypothetical protein